MYTEIRKRTIYGHLPFDCSALRDPALSRKAWEQFAWRSVCLYWPTLDSRVKLVIKHYSWTVKSNSLLARWYQCWSLALQSCVSKAAGSSTLNGGGERKNKSGANLPQTVVELPTGVMLIVSTLIRRIFLSNRLILLLIVNIILSVILKHTFIQGLFITCSTVNRFCGSVLKRPLIRSLASSEINLTCKQLQYERHKTISGILQNFRQV